MSLSESSKDFTIFFDAVALATKAHHEQRRKSSTDPYINHPLRVAYLAIDAGLSEHACIAAVLHDVVEDTDVDISEIFSKFPYHAANTVRYLTKWWGDDISAEERRRNMVIYYDQILGNVDAVNIKLLDRIDNLRDMLLLLPKQTSWVRKYLKKTEEEFPRLYAASDNQAIQELYNGTIELVKKRLNEIGSSPF